MTFPTKLASGAPFEVTLDAQPSNPPQTCVVSGGKGTVAVGDVTSVTVNCTTLYTVGGTVTGLAGKDLVLENNGSADSVTINANGQFAFPKPLAAGQAYAVTVKQNPTNKWQTCKVSTGDAGADSGAGGVIGSSNVTNIDVVCVTNTYDLSVKVTGLAGTGLVLQNKGADDLSAPANAIFTFASKVESGAEYDVKPFTQPTNPWQVCTVTNGKALMAGANVTLDASCVTSTFKVGGTLSGLQGNGLVLQNSAGDDLTRNAAQNGAFSFATPVESGKPYAVTVKTQPNGVAGEMCTVSSGAGNVAGADVTTVSVSCSVDKKVFVTSVLYNGNLGGLDGADAKCQARATAANLPGTYRAWLSDNTGSPSSRFTQSIVPYVLVDGTKIANNWADLVDGTLLATITKTELGGTVPLGNTICAGGGFPTVWSNTTTSGAQVGAGLSCSNWTNGEAAAAPRGARRTT